MKIAIYSALISHGAFCSVIAGLSHALQLNGYKDIDILYVDDSLEIPKEKFPSNIRFIRLDCKRTLTSIIPLKKYLNEEKPDLLISMPAYVNIIAIISKLLSRWHGVLIITEHATMSIKKVEHKGEFVMGNMDVFAKIFYRFSNGLIGVSKGVVKDLNENIKLTRPRMWHIPNPVDCELIKKKSLDKKKLHSWLSENKDIPCFVSVGRLAKQKNPRLLIESFRLIKTKFDSRLLIIGDGPLRAELELLIKQYKLADSVQILGHLKNPYSYIKYSDCFVLSSDEEGFGLVVVEALALETPIVAVDAAGGGPGEILDGGKFGLLSEIGSSQALAANMEKMITCKDVRDNFISLSLNRAKVYQPKAIGLQWKKLIVELLHKR